MRLCITAALFPAADQGNRKSKYINNLVDDWEDNENTYYENTDYLIRLQNKYNTNIWFYRPTAMLHHSSIVDDRLIAEDGEPITKNKPIIKDRFITKDKPTTNDKPITEDEDKIEILQKYSNFVKVKNVKILVWNEHAALIKNIEVLLEEPNTKNTKYWFCDKCTLWFPTQQKI